MSDSIKCPECKKEHDIAEMELWSVYEAEGKQTELNCLGCDADLIITSTVARWDFEVEIND